MDRIRVLWALRSQMKGSDGLEQWKETGSDLRCASITCRCVKCRWDGARADQGCQFRDVTVMVQLIEGGEVEGW